MVEGVTKKKYHPSSFEDMYFHLPQLDRRACCPVNFSGERKGNCGAFCWGLVICQAPSQSPFPLTHILLNKGIISNKELEARRNWALVRVIKASKQQAFRGGKAPSLAALALPLTMTLLPSISSKARYFDTSKRSFVSAHGSSQFVSSKESSTLGKHHWVKIWKEPQEG